MPTSNPSVRLEETPFDGSRLYVPTGPGPHPGVILLHGSGGGTHAPYQLLALYLAAHGYAALAFAYYGAKDFLVGPRECLRDVDLFKTYEAFQWLKTSGYSRGKKVAIHGASRGAEQALFLASLLASKGLESPDAVAVHAPSDVIYGSWNWDWNDPKCWLPDLNDPSKKIWNAVCGADPRLLKPEDDIAWRWNAEPFAAGPRIEIEKYLGPVFISHGTADQVWSVEQAKRIEVCLTQLGRKVDCHYFEGEGHQLGALAENRRNQLLLEFLGRHLS